MNCPSCGSDKLQKRGYFVNASGLKRRSYSCNSCGRRFNETHNKTKFEPSKILIGQRYVITSVQNNTSINEKFLTSLETYCKENSCELLIIPTLHNKTAYKEIEWPIDEADLLREKVSLNNFVNILSDTPIVASADNPLAGLDTFSKGKSLILPHNQLQMRSLPVQANDNPIILITTGTISEPSYTRSKAGEKAEFNHSYSAIVVEFEPDFYHLRILNADDTGGFYDIEKYYCESSVSPTGRIEALITGDEHVYVKDDEVTAATYTSKDSILNVLKPKYIIRHDVLDSFTISHHHKKDSFLQYSKYITQKNNIEEELNQTLKFVIDTTPDDTQTVIISSNHNDHLKRWLNECDPKQEPWNALAYHFLMFRMLGEINKSPDKISSPDPFELYFRFMSTPKEKKKIKFLGRREKLKIKGIELSNHGDIGANGSRGSLNQFARFADKMVIGHSHTPGINKGSYSVGCSTPKSLEYTNGPSSWMNTHCVIYPNGKRQLISIIRGKWRKA